MSYTFDSRLGEQLYQLLPEVYRTRDKTAGQLSGGSGTEDLAKFLDAQGHLLDLIHATLEQQLKDGLPESSQDWLLPYFARLLAANIVSPDSEGKHAEIQHAVSWRQRKGTLKCAEEIAEAVGQIEVEIQEGWKRVAVTPRIGMPIIPARAWDDTLRLDMGIPSEAARHPNLPAAMVDLRRPSKAVPADSTNPAARVTSFGGVKQTWRQANLHGVPCFPGSFDDVSRRTVDIRTPQGAIGHYHHKRLLVYAPPQTGFFGLDPEPIAWDGDPKSLPEDLIEVQETNGVLSIRNRTDRIVEITNDVELKARQYRIEGIRFQGVLTIPGGGTIEIVAVEVGTLNVNTASTEEFVLTARDSLFGVLSSQGRVNLDSCTVLIEANIPSIEALDCIFMDIQGKDITGTIAYSRIPEHAPLSADSDKMAIATHHPGDNSRPVHDDPLFIPGQSTLRAKAVLSPNTPSSIFIGASDHGEMGYYHRGRNNRPVHINGNASGYISFTPPADGGYPLADLIFDADVAVTEGQLALIRSAAPVLVADSPADSDKAVPSLSATDCLFKSVLIPDGLVRLEYCTVMEDMACKHLQASDCIFAGTITGVEKQNDDDSLATFFNCLRYSVIPPGFLEDISDKAESSADKKLARALRLIDDEDRLTLRTNTLEKPFFDEFSYCEDTDDGPYATHRKARYAEWGYGVLGLQTPGAIRFGAEDGGEMGAYHHKFYCLKAEAVLDKMREFLPVGIEPVLIQDTRLLIPPSK